jgi:cytochrome c-type biogenesis protein CcsB
MIVSYALAATGYLGSLVWRKERAARYSFIPLSTGLTLNLIIIGQRWVAGGHAPLASLYDVLLALAAMIVLFSLAIGYRLKILSAGLFAAGFALLLSCYASSLDDGIRPLLPALRSNLLVFHVATYILGYAACAVAFAAAAVYLGISRRSAFAALADKLEGLMHSCVLFAFPFLTLGMSSGMVWADIAWGRYWGWDPKEAWSLIAWLIYGYYVHMRLLGAWGGRRAAYLSVAGFGAILFTLFGVNLLMSGLHSYR